MASDSNVGSSSEPRPSDSPRSRVRVPDAPPVVGRTRGRPPKEEAGQVRESILAAAIELFAERGFSVTSVGSVCRRAGVGKPALYWHFESKTGLLEAVIEEIGQRWIARIEKQQPKPGEDGLELLIAAFRDAALEEDPVMRVPLMLQLEAEETGATAAAARLWAEAAIAVADNIRETLGLDLPDLDLIGHSALILLAGATNRYHIDRDRALLDRLLHEAARTVRLQIWDRLPDDLRTKYVPAPRPSFHARPRRIP